MVRVSQVVKIVAVRSREGMRELGYTNPAEEARGGNDQSRISRVVRVVLAKGKDVSVLTTRKEGGGSNGRGRFNRAIWDVRDGGEEEEECLTTGDSGQLWCHNGRLEELAS